MTVRERLHELIEQLPEGELHTAERFLDFLRAAGEDSLVRALDEAPYDDEPLTDDDTAAIAEGWEQYRRGEYRRWDDVKAELNHD